MSAASANPSTRLSLRGRARRQKLASRRPGFAVLASSNLTCAISTCARCPRPSEPLLKSAGTSSASASPAWRLVVCTRAFTSPGKYAIAVDTRVRQVSGPALTRALPTPCGVERRPTPVGTAKRRRPSKTPGDRKRLLGEALEIGKDVADWDRTLEDDRSPWRRGDAQGAPPRARRHMPGRCSMSGDRSVRAVRDQPSAREMNSCIVEATSARTMAAREELSTRANWEASASRRSSASRSPRNCAGRRSLSRTASATLGMRASCAKCAHARRRALSRLIAAISHRLPMDRDGQLPQWCSCGGCKSEP